MQKALETLEALIKAGTEYPEAHAAVCIGFALDDSEAEELTKLYDGV